MENWIIENDGSESQAPFEAPEKCGLFDIYYYPKAGGGYDQFLLVNRLWIAKGTSYLFKIQWARFDGTPAGRLKTLKFYGYIS